MISVEIREPCYPRWYMFWIWKDKVPPGTGLVGDGLTLRDKNIDLNKFNIDILSDAIE